MIAETITSTVGAMRDQQSTQLVGRARQILSRELSFVPNRNFVEMQHQDAWRGCGRVDGVEDAGMVRPCNCVRAFPPIYFVSAKSAL